MGSRVGSVRAMRIKYHLDLPNDYSDDACGGAIYYNVYFKIINDRFTG